MALVDLSCLSICVLFTWYGSVLKGKKKGRSMSVSVSSFRRIRHLFLQRWRQGRGVTEGVQHISRMLDFWIFSWSLKEIALKFRIRKESSSCFQFVQTCEISMQGLDILTELFIMERNVQGWSRGHFDAVLMSAQETYMAFNCSLVQVRLPTFSSFILDLCHPWSWRIISPPPENGHVSGRCPKIVLFSTRLQYFGCWSDAC